MMLLLESDSLIDPLSGRRLRLKQFLVHPLFRRTWYGVLAVEGGRAAYPITEGVPRIYAPLPRTAALWVTDHGYEEPAPRPEAFQELSTVNSFAFEWTFDPTPRTQEDLRWRVADRFGIDPASFNGKLVLDAGCGAGAQSRFLLDHGARVVSIDLSSAVDVASRLLGGRGDWLGIQGDVTTLPFSDALFDFVYCEGVLQHTRDSAAAVRELWRVLKPGGRIAATHYTMPRGALSRLKFGLHERLRSRLSRSEPTRLLAFTGFLTALGYVPLRGLALKKLGIVVHNPRMPSFKATWSCSYDSYGSHPHQRHIHPREFMSYFERAGQVRPVFQAATECVVYLEKAQPR